MNVNIEIVYLDFLKSDFLDLRGLWFGQQNISKSFNDICPYVNIW